MRQKTAIYVLIALLLASIDAICCTRITYHSLSNHQVATGRNMDWLQDIPLRIWKFPRGMVKSGVAGNAPIQWESRYGSVVVSGYEVGVPEGMNEQGLSVHLLWLPETEYGRSEHKPSISVGAWAQFVLDNYATTSEAVGGLMTLDLQIVAPMLLPGKQPKVYLSIVDQDGHCATIEYIDGEQHIYLDDSLKVVTNIPYPKAKQLQESVEKSIKSVSDLPGDIYPSGKYTRANFYLSKLPDGLGAFDSVISIRSILEAVSVPRIQNNKNPSWMLKTIYRTLFDQTKRIFYYQGMKTPYWFYVPLDKMDFSVEADVLSFDTNHGKIIPYGDCSQLFKKEAPFKFLR